MSNTAIADVTGRLPPEKLTLAADAVLESHSFATVGGLLAYTMHGSFPTALEMTGHDREDRLHLSILLQGRIHARSDGRNITLRSHETMAASQPGIAWHMRFCGPVHDVGLLVQPDTLVRLAGAMGESFLYRLRHRDDVSINAGTAHALSAAHALDALLRSAEADNALLCEARSLEVLARLLQWNEDAEGCTTLAATQRRRLQHARDKLLADLTHAPTLDALARDSGLNVFTLKHGFKLLFGTTAHAMHRQARLQQAWRLIETGQMNVSEAGTSVGYTSLSHFTIAFHKAFGIRPGELKRRSACAQANPLHGEA